jgi:hypothetical protein
MYHIFAASNKRRENGGEAGEVRPMKNIIAALKQNVSPVPQSKAKWWGYEKDGVRYLMRYHHKMLEIHNGKEIKNVWYETRTDKTGVEYAIKYLNLPVTKTK